jgi:xylulokinase
MFLPYLGGERTPHNDVAIRGQFLHLDHATDARAAARAVLQGVSFAFADCKDVLAATGTEISRAVVVGGGTQSDHWVQMLANTLHIPLDRPADGAFGASLGAARLAMIASGLPATSVLAPPEAARSFEPETTGADAFDDGHSRYKTAEARLKEL